MLEKKKIMDGLNHYSLDKEGLAAALMDLRDDLTKELLQEMTKPDVDMLFDKGHFELSLSPNNHAYAKDFAEHVSKNVGSEKPDYSHLPDPSNGLLSRINQRLMAPEKREHAIERNEHLRKLKSGFLQEVSEGYDAAVEDYLARAQRYDTLVHSDVDNLRRLSVTIDRLVTSVVQSEGLPINELAAKVSAVLTEKMRNYNELRANNQSVKMEQRIFDIPAFIPKQLLTNNSTGQNIYYSDHEDRRFGSSAIQAGMRITRDYKEHYRTDQYHDSYEREEQNSQHMSQGECVGTDSNFKYTFDAYMGCDGTYAMHSASGERAKKRASGFDVAETLHYKPCVDLVQKLTTMRELAQKEPARPKAASAKAAAAYETEQENPGNQITAVSVHSRTNGQEPITPARSDKSTGFAHIDRVRQGFEAIEEARRENTTPGFQGF